jgi:hypothetical protein
MRQKRFKTIPDLELYTGSSPEEARAVLVRTPIDHVIIGGELDLDTRLNSCAKSSSEATGPAVKMKVKKTG